MTHSEGRYKDRYAIGSATRPGTKYDHIAVWDMTHGPQGRRRATVHEKDTTGKQARYTETGPTHRNRNETGTETPEQRSTGTRDANTVAAMHANTGNTMHGNRAREWNREEGGRGDKKQGGARQASEDSRSRQHRIQRAIRAGIGFKVEVWYEQLVDVSSCASEVPGR